ELFYAAGLTPVNMELVAGWLSSLHLSRDYISRSEGNGFSPSICSYHKATLGLIEDGGLSRPFGAAVSSHICDGGVGVANFFRHKYGTDTFVLNVPFDRKAINKDYLIEQYRNLVAWIENYTGKKLSDDKIREALELSNKTREYWLKVLEHRKGDPVVPGRFMLRNLFGATFLFGSQFGYEVVKAYHDEMLERYEKAKENNSHKNHKRILWIHFAPLYNNNLLEYLEDELGCSVVFDITGHIYWPEYDIEKPLESLAERTLSHFYLGKADDRNRLYTKIIRDYKIDGVIHMMHSGCRAIPGASWQVRDGADELNIPYLELSGDCIDPRGFSEEQMKLRLEAFKETVWRR
ncbi:MAG: 2-hydroxyacyl-CoA dehydratase family protein, partial [Clostridiales bacterium]|nr:2-hydroxyacyl-CoA dehydratase family protein [Clostridiales bacterium]